MSFHYYADYTRLYFPLRHSTYSFDSLLASLKRYQKLDSVKFFKVNEDKTEVIFFGQANGSIMVLLNLSSLAPYSKMLVKDLGFLIDDKPGLFL